MSIDWARIFRALRDEPEPKEGILLAPPATIETLREVMQRMSKGMTDADQCKLWYEIEKTAFNELGEVRVDTFEISPVELEATLREQYPDIQDLKFPDGTYWTTNVVGMQRILSRDWTNMVPYVVDKSDCDKYGIRLYEHCCRYYEITTVFPIWGMTTQGYHGFNALVLKGADGWIARLIEPQSDVIFITDGPLGGYHPDTASESLGLLNLSKGVK
jgi:hypothetical protein